MSDYSWRMWGFAHILCLILLGLNLFIESPMWVALVALVLPMITTWFWWLGPGAQYRKYRDRMSK